ncbi:uncharacterized protein LOC143306877 [Osmia lignaria lignaria]|uniref:uncharacterized protein LOC143306877 n=1 Tax=Osmia lignaria lignaria TaxID=1437193 RepID=UPI00402B7D4E
MASRYRNTKEENEGRIVFVTRIPPFTKTKELLKLFKEFRPEHAVVARKSTGTQGYVTFPQATLAAEAIAWVKNTQPIFHKRRIRAALADPWHEAKLLRPRDGAVPFPGWEPRPSPPLPIEAITRIARLLPFADRARMECVSRAWRMGSMASYAGTNRLDLTDWRWPQAWESRRITTEMLNWAVRRLGVYITDLRLDDGRVVGRLRPQVLGIVVRHCPNLVKIDLTGTLLRPSAVRDLIASANSLRELELGSCLGSVDPELSALFAAATRLERFGATGTAFVGASLPRLTPALRSLRVKRCESLSPAPVAAFLRAARSLVDLELAQCTAITTEEPLHALIANTALHSTLEELSICDINFVPAPEPAADDDDFEVPPDQPLHFLVLQIGPAEAATSIPEAFKNLKNLSTMFCGWVGNGFVIHIGEHLAQLTDLNLSGCSNIRGQFALEPLERLTALRRLAINNLHPTVGAQVLGNISTLEEVNCRDSLGVTDEDACTAAQGCPNLVALNMEGCLGITERTLRGITNIVRGQG